MANEIPYYAIDDQWITDRQTTSEREEQKEKAKTRQLAHIFSRVSHIQNVFFWLAIVCIFMIMSSVRSAIGVQCLYNETTADASNVEENAYRISNAKETKSELHYNT